jgi:hypothetical protein
MKTKYGEIDPEQYNRDLTSEMMTELCDDIISNNFKFDKWNVRCIMNPPKDMFNLCIKFGNYDILRFLYGKTVYDDVHHQLVNIDFSNIDESKSDIFTLLMCYFVDFGRDYSDAHIPFLKKQRNIVNNKFLDQLNVVINYLEDLD